MERIVVGARSLSASIAAALMAAGASVLELPRGRPMAPTQKRIARKAWQEPGRSRYMPHYGAKEQARAARCYMTPTFNCSGNLRSAPTMCQLAK